MLNALRQDSLAKLDSEPDLVAISGRPAYVLVGGEIGYQVTNALSGTMVGFKEYGTRLDFVPIVLGNGRMHIDVRARVSEPGRRQQCRRHSRPDDPRDRDRRGIAGRADAGHCRFDRSSTVEATNQGLPWISEIPYLGVPFRSVSHPTNEVELIVLVTPQIVDGMEPGQVPACLPGMETTDPSDWELFFKGHLEVPNCCPDEPAVCPHCPPSGSGGGFRRAKARPTGKIRKIRTAANQMAMNPQPAEPGFIGPIGYDVLK